MKHDSDSSILIPVFNREEAMWNILTSSIINGHTDYNIGMTGAWIGLYSFVIASGVKYLVVIYVLILDCVTEWNI